MFLTINLVHTVGHAVESRHDIHAPEEAESAHDAKNDLISGLLQVSRILSTCNTQKENDEIRIDDEKKGRWLVFSHYVHEIAPNEAPVEETDTSPALSATHSAFLGSRPRGNALVKPEPTTYPVCALCSTWSACPESCCLIPTQRDCGEPRDAERPEVPYVRPTYSRFSPCLGNYLRQAEGVSLSSTHTAPSRGV